MRNHQKFLEYQQTVAPRIKVAEPSGALPDRVRPATTRYGRTGTLVNRDRTAPQSKLLKFKRNAQAISKDNHGVESGATPRAAHFYQSVVTQSMTARERSDGRRSTLTGRGYHR